MSCRYRWLHCAHSPSMSDRQPGMCRRATPSARSQRGQLPAALGIGHRAVPLRRSLTAAMKTGQVSCTLIGVSRRIALAALQLLERLVFGGRLRERVLLLALGAYYRSLYRRQWAWSQEPPHFFDHRMGAFDLLVGRGNPYALARAFHAVEVMRQGDRVLDIGCGDGFFTSRFFAPRASAVDAVD